MNLKFDHAKRVCVLFYGKGYNYKKIKNELKIDFNAIKFILKSITYAVSEKIT